MKQVMKQVNYYYNWLDNYREDCPTLICFHGFTGSQKTFEASFHSDFFTCRLNYNILLVDLIGHGNSDVYVHPYRYKMESVCQDLHQLFTALGLRKYSLLGYSMGGRVAIAYTYYYPKEVRQLIIENATAGICSVDDRKKDKLMIVI